MTTSDGSAYKGLAFPVALVAALFSILVVCVSIYLVFYLIAVTRNAVLDVADAIIPCSETVKNIQPTCWYALTVGVISSLFTISPDEVLCEYTRDIDARTWIVRHSFPPNPLTKRFMTKYPSRFLSNGYDISPSVTLDKFESLKEGRQRKSEGRQSARTKSSSSRSAAKSGSVKTASTQSSSMKRLSSGTAQTTKMVNQG